jgi:hypothetical protein
MDDSFRQFEYFIDSKEENKIFVKFKNKLDSSEIEEFVIIYFTLIDKNFFQVMRYDFSLREKFRVHHFFDGRKVYFDEKPSFETLFNLCEDLEKCWQKYLIKFNNR